MIDNRLKHIVRGLESKIIQQCPEAVVTVSYDTFEDVDAIIRAYVPTDQVETLDESSGQWTYDVILDEGYNIIIWVYDLAQLPQAEQAA